MATDAYILINVNIGKEEKLVEEIRKIEEVVEAYVLMGEYDVIAKLKINDPKELRPIVSNKIRPLAGVRQTMTLISV